MLEPLLTEIEACRTCRDRPQFLPGLPHEPRPVIRLSRTIRICVSGQAPGTKVHASGLPFDDRSGDRLRDWIGVSREEFYDVSRIGTVPMGFCFPGQDAKGGDLPPRRECTKIWHDRVFAALPDVALILAIGQYAQAYHLGVARKASLTDTVKAWSDFYKPEAKCRYMPLPHPSWRNTGWLKKNGWFEAELLPVLRADLRVLLQMRDLEATVPKPS